MKRLTMNQVAKASLKANRKAYCSLAIGIFLAVYLASAMIQGIDATVLANEKKLVSRVGWADAVLLNADEAVTDEKIRSSGLFAQAGKVFVSARIGETGLYAGYYDEAAAAIVAEKAQGPLVLDLTADWCRACREMDETTFADPDVAEELSRFPARLRLDCTDADDPAVRRAMEIVGAPGLPFSAVLAPRPAGTGAEPR